MSTASVAQQPPTSPVRRVPVERTNPWQRVLALIALLPAVIGAGFALAGYLNRSQPGFSLLAFLIAAYAVGVAAGFAFVWLVVAAITWQIREAARTRG